MGRPGWSISLNYCRRKKHCFKLQAARLQVKPAEAPHVKEKVQKKEIKTEKTTWLPKKGYLKIWPMAGAEIPPRRTDLI